ncbi:MAG TPA: hypothetical protein VHV82_16765 [Sporichthyaceae bacterium]|jgi:hypothetical protein|nr:hypothetical protein [Sporichthyaceae bacterium]
MVVLSVDKPVRIRWAVAGRGWVGDESRHAAAGQGDPVNFVLALVNWMVLLLLFAALLLLKTLPSGSDVIGGVASVTCQGKTCSQIHPAQP